MPPQDETRRRLIDAAGEIFAEHGFRAATVRDICSKASANVAAVNYYFGDKKGLYIETVQAAHCGSPDMVQPEWPEGITPREKLRWFIRRWLETFLDNDRPAWHSQLMMREMAEPTEACVKLVEAFIRPMSETLRQILRELLPADIPEERRWLIGFSIVGQCLFYKVQRPVIELLYGTDRLADLNVERLAEHIARFSLAAIASLESNIPSGNPLELAP